MYLYGVNVYICSLEAKILKIIYYCEHLHKIGQQQITFDNRIKKNGQKQNDEFDEKTEENALTLTLTLMLKNV